MSIFRKNKKNRINVEKPIKSETEDLYNYSSYVNNLHQAVNNGANFIAIDGEYGSGKSSVISLYQEKVKDKNRKLRKNKILYSFVNFMNVDNTYLSINKENDKFRTDDYNRFFVNEVINDLYKNPYEFEKMFYYNSISFGVQRTDLFSPYKAFLDGLMLILSSFIIVSKAYDWLFLDNSIISYWINIFTISAVFVLLVLIMMYGINIYKPDSITKSPMLDVDKCRNNFAKALISNIAHNGVLYIVIDDLDRLDAKEQEKFISMIYNEYKPLNEQFGKRKIVFVFMVNTKQIGGNSNKFDASKIFDFILPIASNQNEILEEYIHKQFSVNFPNASYDKQFIFRTIRANYESVRDIKHLVNKIIIKEEYLISKKVSFNNYTELFLVTILTDLFEKEMVCNYIRSSMNDEWQNVDNENANLDELEQQYLGEQGQYNLKISNPNTLKPELQWADGKINEINEELNSLHREKEKRSALKNIVEEARTKSVFDPNYLLCIYNFIEPDSLLSPDELEIRKFTLNINDIDNYSEKIDKVLDLARIKVVYNRIYKKLCGNMKKLVLISKDKFWNYVKNEKIEKDALDQVSLGEAYLLKDFNKIIPKLLPTLKEDVLPFATLIITNKSDGEKYNNELKKYIVNSGEYFFKVCVPELFSDIEINEEIVKLLNNMNCELPEYVMDSIIKENIKRNYNEFIETSLFKKKEYELYLYSKIINGTITNDEFINNHELGKVVLKIISEMTQSWYEENKVDSSIFEVIVKTENIKKICTFESWKIVELILKTKKSTYLPKIFDELVNNERFDEIVSLLIRNNKDRVTTKIVSLIESRKSKIKDSGVKRTVTRYLNALQEKTKK